MKSSVGRFLERVKAWTGLDGGMQGARSVQRRAEARASALGLDLDEFLDRLNDPRDPDAIPLVNLITVGHTWFFRDPDQLAIMTSLFRERAGARPLQVWVAGCATGEEAWSLAILAREASVDIRIFATDLNTDAVARAREGSYGAAALRQVPAATRERFFEKAGDRLVIVDSLRGSCSFERWNLLEAPPRPVDAPGWDFIVCRNVLMYFPPACAERVVSSFGDVLARTGSLALGAADFMIEGGDLERVERHGRYFLEHRRTRAPSDAEITVRVAIPFPLSPTPAPAPTRSPDAAPTIATRVSLASTEASTAAAAPAPRSSTAPSELDRALYCLKRMDLDGAAPLLEAAMAREPLRLEPRFFFGVTRYLAGDHAAAHHAFRAVVFLDPSCWLAAYYLAMSCRNLGREPEARREFARVLEHIDGSHHLEGAEALIGDLEPLRGEMKSLVRARLGHQR